MISVQRSVRTYDFIPNFSYNIGFHNKLQLQVKILLNITVTSDDLQQILATDYKCTRYFFKHISNIL